MYVFKRDLCDDNYGAHLTSFGIKFQAKVLRENDQSLSVALLCSALLRRGIACWIQRVLRESDRYFLQHISDILLCRVAVIIVA